MKTYSQYSEPKQVWLDKIPSHWREVRLKRVVKKLDRIAIEDSQVLICSNKGEVILKGNKRIGLSAANEDSYQGVVEGDLLIHGMDTWHGAIAISKYSGKCTTVVHVCDSTQNKRYYAYFLRMYAFKKLYKALTNGVRQNTSDLRSWSKAGDIAVVLPPLKEQDQIAHVLDWKVSEVNGFIRKTREEIKLLHNLKSSIVSKAVTCGLSFKGETKRISFWGDTVPNHWQERRFRSLFTLSKGLGITKANLIDTGIPCVNYGEVHSKYGFEVDPDIHPLKCVDEEYLIKAPKSLLRYGDFIFADTSEDLEGSGNFTYLNSNRTTFAGYHTIIARSIFPINNRYFAYMFDSLAFRMQIRRSVNAVKVYSITRTILNGARIMIPPTEEQQAIVDYLDKRCAAIDAMIAALKSQIALIVEYRTRLISDMVTGKVDVRDVQVPEFVVEEVVENTADEEICDEVADGEVEDNVDD